MGNSQVILSNLTTESQAANHWSTIGIYQGLQACGSFSVLQFLDNYPSLKQKYGNNYTAAIEYYLQPNGGYDQQLLGYTVGGGYGRYTLGNVSGDGLYISATLRMGGSITSLVWNNIEFINNWGHGRQLQLTVHNGSSACYSPTEAGTKADEHYNYSTSIINYINTTETRFESSVQSAYWMYSGQYLSKCGYAINTVNVSNYTINKQISFGYKGKMDLGAISYNNSFYIPEDQLNTTLTFESPTAYLNQPFNQFYGLNTMNNMEVINYTIAGNGGHANTNGSFPIIATEDLKAALGVVPVQLKSIRDFAIYSFLTTEPDSNECTKWSIVQREKNVKKGTWFHFQNYLCIGDFDKVKDCMVYIYNDLNQNYRDIL